LGQTNFGFLSVRVAKSISKFFGGGELRNSEAATGESEIFGKPARWIDYLGPVRVQGSRFGIQPREGEVVEGVTYFDHADNPGYPAQWHVREDGWMGASFNRSGPYVLRRNKPLMLRYLLHAHTGVSDPNVANQIAKSFNERPAFQLKRHSGPHVQFDVTRR
jgi:hypothetical protein